MRRMLKVISLAVLSCALLAAGAAAAENKDEAAEANAQANAYWEGVLSKCGDSYFAKFSNSPYELNGLDFPLYQEP